MGGRQYKDEFLVSHLITYIGNKRKLLSFIDNAIYDIRKEISKSKATIFDGFSGSGCVSRIFKYDAEHLYVNDIEAYSNTINKCYLSNRTEVDFNKITKYIDELNAHRLDENIPGFIEKNYAPKSDNDIKNGERVFYTNRNAKIIDNIRREIGKIEIIDKEIVPFVLAPLLVKASIHNNTSGVFKGFHKKDDIGHFGGKGENALLRIKSDIKLDYPIFSKHECPVSIFNGDTNKIVLDLPEIDIAYYDPPYNQHPYGSNYFMLNIINNYDNPVIQNGVSGIAKEWNRSAYNKQKTAEEAMSDLIYNTKARYIVISYNNEGIIPISDFKNILEKFGRVNMRDKTYTTYRGSKNFGKDKIMLNGEKRSVKVRELLWILKKDGYDDKKIFTFEKVVKSSWDSSKCQKLC